MIVAVTGNTGSGKSTVASLFVRWGGRLIDADRIGRSVWEEDREIGRRIRAALGEEIAGPDGAIDRALLGRAVFGDRAKLEAFDRIVQPLLRRKIAARLARAREEPDAIWILDAALLFEWSLEGMADRVVVVTAPPSARAARIAARHRIAPEEAAGRVAAQVDEEEKIRKADQVLGNDGSLDELAEKARALWEKMVRGRRRPTQGERP